MPRDSAGNYSLPAGNPVVGGTTITTAWANPTLSDVASELTNSLDRAGRGGMTAPFKFADGAVGAPGIAWNSEPTSGIFRNAGNDMQAVIAGVPRMRWKSDSVDVWDTGSASWLAIVGPTGSNFVLATSDVNITGDFVFDPTQFFGFTPTEVAQVKAQASLFAATDAWQAKGLARVGSLGANAELQLRRVNGAYNATTAVLSGQTLSALSIYGTKPANGGAVLAAQMRAYAVEDFTAGVNGAGLYFDVTKLGTTGLFTALQLEGGGAIFNAPVTVTSPTGGQVLSLKGGTSNSCYQGFYGDNTAPLSRTAYIGHGLPASGNFYLLTEGRNGNIIFAPHGTGAVQASADAAVSTARFVSISDQTAGVQRAGIEFGHTNSAGYRSTIGSLNGGDQYVAFHAEPGATAGTFKTRGVMGHIIKTSGASGILQFGRVTNSSADNQVPAVTFAIAADGKVMADTLYDYATAGTKFISFTPTYGSIAVGGTNGGFAGVAVNAINSMVLADDGVNSAGIYINRDGGLTLLIRNSSTTASSQYNLYAPSFNATSSRDIKRETGRPHRARDILARLRPILYRLLERDDREQIGLIAEEVHEVCPQLSPDGKSVAYDRLALLLLADWQERYA